MVLFWGGGVHLCINLARRRAIVPQTSCLGCNWMLSALRMASTLNKKGRSSNPRLPSNSGFFLMRSPGVSPPPCRSFDGSVGCVPIHSWGYVCNASVGRTENTNRTRRGDPQKETTTDLRVRLLLVYLEPDVATRAYAAALDVDPSLPQS